MLGGETMSTLLELLDWLPSREPRRLDPEHAFVSSEPYRRLDVPEGWVLCAGDEAGLDAIEATRLFTAMASKGAPLVGLRLGEESPPLITDALDALFLGAAAGRLHLLQLGNDGVVMLRAERLVQSALRAFETGRAPYLDVLGRLPHLLRSVRARSIFSGRVFTDLTSGPAFAELYELELRGVRGYDDEVAAWVASGRTASLRGLELTCEHASDVVNALSPEAAAVLAGADWGSLEELRLDGQPVGDEAVMALANNPTLRRLRKLSLARCRLGAPAVEALARSPLGAQLRELDLSGNEGAEQVITAFGERAGLALRSAPPLAWPETPAERGLLVHRLEIVYGCQFEPSRHQHLARDLAHGEGVVSFQWVLEVPPGGNLMRAVVAGHARHYTALYSELFGLLTNSVLVAVPFRHEAAFLEVEPPHERWQWSEGWRRQDGYRSEGNPFEQRVKRAWWLCQLMMPGGVREGVEYWLTKLDAEPLDAFLGRAQGPYVACAEALQALWATWFLGDDDTLEKVIDGFEGHRSLAVRHACVFLRGPADDPWLSILDANRRELRRRLPRDESKSPEFDRLLASGDLRPVWGREGCFVVRSGGTLSASAAVDALRALDRRVVGLDLAIDSAPMGLLRLLASPDNERLRVLRVSGRALVASLLVSCRALEELDLRSLSLSDLRALAQLPSPLRRLGANSAPIGPEGFELLASADAFRALEALHLTGTRSGDEGFAVWARSGRTATLRELTLWNWSSGEIVEGFREAGALALCEAPLGRLERFSLRSHPVGDPAAIALARNPNLGPLRDLTIEGGGLGPEGVAALADCERLDTLECFDLSRTNCGSDGATAVARSPYLRALRELHLFAVGDEGAEALAREGQFVGLKRLHLERSRLTRAGLAALAAAPWLASVEELDLQSNALDAEALRVLVESPFAQGLTDLQLFENPLGPAAAPLLSAALPRLRKLGVTSTGLGSAAIEALRALRAGVQVQG